MIRILIGFYVSELNLIPEIINFTNEVGLTDYFIDSLEGMKENEWWWKEIEWKKMKKVSTPDIIKRDVVTDPTLKETVVSNKTYWIERVKKSKVEKWDTFTYSY